MSPLPLVSIGIPTYNRAPLIGRAVESALAQDHPNVEVLISDNASTDDTAARCDAYARQHANVRYLRQPSNLGATANFNSVLRMARGEYFMWLGDDDWIDPDYVSRTLQRLRADPNLVLVSGRPVYYANGVRRDTGKVLSISAKSAFRRMLWYYWLVSDNGVFYGLMRRASAAPNPSRNAMGGDWIFIASLALRGGILMLQETAVHRELGGATASYEAIARAQGLPMLHARFPFLAIARAAAADIVSGAAGRGRSLWRRWIWAAAAFTCLLTKASRIHTVRVIDRITIAFKGTA